MGILIGVVLVVAGVGVSLGMALATVCANRWVRLPYNGKAPTQPTFSRAATAVSAGLCVAGVVHLVSSDYAGAALGILAAFVSPSPVICWHNARLYGEQRTSRAR